MRVALIAAPSHLSGLKRWAKLGAPPGLDFRIITLRIITAHENI